MSKNRRFQDHKPKRPSLPKGQVENPDRAEFRAKKRQERARRAALRWKKKGKGPVGSSDG